MPTITVKSIGTSSRDYSTLQAWEDAAAANLVTSDVVWKGECYNDSEFSGTGTMLTIAGSTTDTTRYKWLTAAAGQSFQDHASVRSNALLYNQSLGVGITCSSGSVSTIVVTETNAHLTRVMVQQSAASPVDSAVNAIKCSVDNLFLQNVLVDTMQIGIRFGGNGASAFNVVAVNRSASNICLYSANVCTFIGCTVVRESGKTPAGTGVLANYGTCVMQSTAIFGCTTPTSGPWHATNSKYNATDKATSGLPGTNNTYSVTYSSSTPFESAAIASLDLRAKDATALAAAGFLDATNAPNDISGTARAASPTVGAWELVPAAAANQIMSQWPRYRSGTRPFPFRPGQPHVGRD